MLLAGIARDQFKQNDMHEYRVSIRCLIYANKPTNNMVPSTGIKAISELYAVSLLAFRESDLSAVSPLNRVVEKNRLLK